MWKNHLRIAIRHLSGSRAITGLNVAGLVVGMASCLLILLYVQDERSYDRFHPDADPIYRLTQPETVVTPGPLAPSLATAYPGVLAYARVLPTLGDVLIKDTGTHRFYESRFYWADSSLLDVFAFSLLKGDPQRALADVNSLVITEDIARKYFGEADPIGQTLIFDVGFEAALQVTGVMRNLPAQSHFRPDFLASLATFDRLGVLDLSDWSQAYFHTYVVLDDSETADAIEAALPAFTEQQDNAPEAGYRLQPITDIHLRSTLRDEMEPAGSLASVYGFSAIGLLILVIACVNFINLSTARFAQRAREVGLRKVLGASRGSLVTQFLGESVLLTLLALGLALPLVYVCLPSFNALVGKTLAFQTLGTPVLIRLLAGMALGVGVGAGSYPAFLLAGYAPVRTLRGDTRREGSGLSVRKGLVVMQFAIGIGLVVGTLVIHNQLSFIRTRNLGYAQEQRVVIAARMYGHATTPLPFESMQQAFASHAGVLQVAATGSVPGTNPRPSPFFLEGMADRDAMAGTTWNLYSVDYDLLETLNLGVLQGRSFSRDVPADEGSAYLINEAAWRAAREVLGPSWDTPVGKKLDRYFRIRTEWILGKPGRVVGIVRDFHYQSLHHRIAPLVLQLNSAVRDHFIVRIRPDDAPGTLAHLEATWRTFAPDRPFEYYFLDDAFQQRYQAEQRTASLLGLFTGLSLLIACLGLLGLAAFSAQQRTREIGVRKVLGASVGSIVLLLTQDFARLVLVAFFVAAPTAYFLMNRWLDAFAYRIEISWPIFLIAGLAALGVALLTVSYQAIKASLADPVQSLRYE